MKKVILFVLVSACVCKTTGSFGQVNTTDSLALVDIYNNYGGANWINNSGWLDGPVSVWHGITLDVATGTRVAGIGLNSNNLTGGSIPPSIANLTALQILDLGNCQLTGTIPSFFENLTSLFEIDLSNNQLTGTIPSYFVNLTDLGYLYLNNNQFSGGIPSAIGNLVNLKSVYLNNNQLTDSIPSSIGNCTGLDNLYLNNNQLTGSIPASLGNCTEMNTLSLYDNQLTGSIPGSLGGNPFGIYDLYLNHNQLTGSIPTSLFTNGIVLLLLDSNQLSGNLPYNIGSDGNLQVLNLSNNQLSGSIPSAIGNFGTGINDIDLSNNQLTGTIPSTIDLLTGLLRLNLSGNMLSGTVPTITDGTHGAFQLALGNNEFTFNGMEDVAEKVLLANDSYSPQAFIPLHYNAGQYSVSAGGTLSNNTYKWYNAGTLVATIVGDSTFTPSISGNYAVAVTNTIVTNPAYAATDLILYSDSIKVVLDSLNIMPDHPVVEYANRQNINANGWTDYYWDNNTPDDYNDDTLLLSLNTNGQNIGSIGDGTFSVKLVGTAGAGSNTGIELTNPLITNPSGFWVMNRYWLVTPTIEPMANVGVRFYYNNQDLADVNGSYPSHNLTNQKLIFYKAIGGNPDPTTNLAGATGLISILNAGYASDTTWTYHQLTDTTQYAEFRVASFSGGGGGGTGNDEALPIKLLSFTATKEGNKNLLQWTTTTEVNSSYFDVERSGDGAVFTAMGSVTAKGNRVAVSAYSFTDNEPKNGTNYYRLKMMDKDGQFSYSPIRTINEAVSFGVSIYPNPVQNKLSLNFNSDKAMEVQVEIVDNEGKRVAVQQVEVVAGASTESINVSGLSSGSYYVRLVGSEGEMEERFVKE